MSKLDEMIERLCPDGVEYKTLDELGYFYSGLTGKTKEDFQDGNSRYITYMNVFSNCEILDSQLDTVKIGENEKQHKVNYGDVLFTGSSETAEECGMSSVFLIKSSEPVYLNSFCFGLRFYKPESFFSPFFKYIFRSHDVRKQIIRTANGVTRFNVSKKKMEKVRIPVPPLEIQREIVRILDNFTELTAKLTAELTAELTARKKQYEYYRDRLLTFSIHGGKTKWYKIKEICDYVDYRGKTPRKTKQGIFLVTAKNIRKGKIDYETSQEYIDPNDYEEVMHRGKPHIGDVLFTTEAPCGFVAQVDREDIALAQRVIKYRAHQDVLNNDFLKYVLLGSEFQRKLFRAATGSTVKGIKGSRLHELTIPVPPLDEQRHIVSILDRFDKMTNSLTEGLPAEIAARKKQYAYYRDKLLTFKPCKSE